MNAMPEATEPLCPHIGNKPGTQHFGVFDQFHLSDTVSSLCMGTLPDFSALYPDPEPQVRHTVGVQ